MSKKGLLDSFWTKLAGFHAGGPLSTDTSEIEKSLKSGQNLVTVTVKSSPSDRSTGETAVTDYLNAINSPRMNPRTPRVDAAIAEGIKSGTISTYEGVPLDQLSPQKKTEAQNSQVAGMTANELRQAFASFGQQLQGINLKNVFIDGMVKKQLEGKEKYVRDMLMVDFPQSPRPLLVFCHAQKVGNTLLCELRDDSQPRHGRPNDIVVTDLRHILGRKIHEYDLYFAPDWPQNPNGYEILRYVFARAIGQQPVEPHEIWQWREKEEIFGTAEPSFFFANVVVFRAGPLRKSGVLRTQTMDNIIEIRVSEGAYYAEHDERAGLAVYYVKEKRTLPREVLPEDDIDLDGEFGNGDNG